MSIQPRTSPLKSDGLAGKSENDTVSYLSTKAPGPPCRGPLEQPALPRVPRCEFLRSTRRLLLGCIQTDFCNHILILQHSWRCTRFASLCTAPHSKFADFFEFFVKKWWIFEIFANFWWNLLKSAFFRRNFHGFLSELREMLNKFQKCRKKMQKFAKLHEKWWNFADFP